MWKFTVVVAFLCVYIVNSELLLYHAVDSYCLDGSKYGFYFEQSSSPDNSTKWVMMFGSGGNCDSETVCKKRFGTTKGSSVDWTPTLDGSAHQFLSNSSVDNPDFFDWNRVYFPYCTADYHSGMVVDPTSGVLPGFYFSGHINIRNSIRRMGFMGFGAASTVVLTGGSAGGYGVFVNADWISNQVPLAKVVAIPQGGLFLRTMTYPQWSAWNDGFASGVQHKRRPVLSDDFDGAICECNNRTALFDMYQSYASPTCLEAAGDAPYLCIEPTFISLHLKIPLLLGQNLYDTTQMFNLGRAPVPHLVAFPLPPPLSEFANYFALCTRFALRRILAINDQSAAFSPACLGHIFSEDIEGGSKVDEITWRQAQSKWLASGRQSEIWMQTTHVQDQFCPPPDDIRLSEMSELDRYQLAHPLAFKKHHTQDFTSVVTVNHGHKKRGQKRNKKR